MFDQFKAMGALAGLLRDKDRLREMGEEFKRRLAGLRATGTAGGGAVRVTVTGRLQVESVELERALAEGLAHDRSMGEGLIADATNDALETMQRMIAEQARNFAREHDLPDLPGADGLGGLLGS